MPGPLPGPTPDGSSGASADGAPPAIGTAPRLAVLKALGDNTRYAIYLELARSQAPRSTAEIAETLGLHANTVRPHLERMRDVGLLVVVAEGRGTVGRPQHRYALAPDAPSLGLEPPAFPVLARLLANLAASARIGPDEAATAGAEHGKGLAEARRGPARDGVECLRAVTSALDALGFDPAAVDDGRSATVAFTHCPYRELAEAYPELICHLHRGMVEGFVEQIGGADVGRFGTLADRDPCQVELSFR